MKKITIIFLLFILVSSCTKSDGFNIPNDLEGSWVNNGFYHQYEVYKFTYKGNNRGHLRVETFYNNGTDNTNDIGMGMDYDWTIKNGNTLEMIDEWNYGWLDIDDFSQFEFDAKIFSNKENDMINFINSKTNEKVVLTKMKE